MAETTAERPWRQRSRLWPYLQLMRPPNLFTAAADILAGYAFVSAAAPLAPLPWLIGASVCLYAGGVVLNDYFDRELDALERPERPLPSGRARPALVALQGGTLLLLGALLAAMASTLSALLAGAIAALVLLYDSWAKRHALLGPATMASCRALNLLLGVSAAPALLPQHAYLALVPLAYIGAITCVSRAEVHGGSRRLLLGALITLGAIMGGLLALALRSPHGALWACLFVLAFAARVLPAFWRAYQQPAAPAIRTAVRTGVLSLIVLDASLAASAAGPAYATLVLALLLPAAASARIFAVT